MPSGTLLAPLVALSIAWPASAQPAAQKKPVKKTPATVKPSAKTPPPAPAAELPPPPPKDVTYPAKYVNGPQVSENTTYIKGVRERFEFPGVTMITQCDLKRSVQLHDGTGVSWWCRARPRPPRPRRPNRHLIRGWPPKAHPRHWLPAPPSRNRRAE